MTIRDDSTPVFAPNWSASSHNHRAAAASEAAGQLAENTEKGAHQSAACAAARGEEGLCQARVISHFAHSFGFGHELLSTAGHALVSQLQAGHGSHSHTAPPNSSLTSSLISGTLRCAREPPTATAHTPTHAHTHAIARNVGQKGIPKYGTERAAATLVLVVKPH